MLEIKEELSAIIYAEHMIEPVLLRRSIMWGRNDVETWDSI
jgi:hypothetical protein